MAKTPPDKTDAQYIDDILKVLVQKTGVALDHYRRTSLERRITRRMNFLNCAGVKEYWEIIQRNEQEQHLLYKDVLIHVSSFFRDEKSFDYLCSEVIPAIFAEKNEGETVRVWACGCSTGEEAYSVAICMHEHLEAIGRNVNIKIFASDLSDTAISRARLGFYPKSAVAKLSDTRLEKYFEDYKGGKRIRAFIRDLCVFAVHNVLRHPPFAKLDLITCRNVLIYMQPVLQRAVLATFSYALNENGFLFLGKSEANNAGGRFEHVNKSANVFINKERNIELIGKNTAQDKTNKNMSAQERSSNFERKDFQKAADELLLLKYVPAGVIVNDAFDIVDFKGYTGFFIEPSPGIASLSVLKMVRKGLYYDLQESLTKAKAEKVPVKVENIALEHDGKLLRITLDVQPLPGTKEKFYLILFHNVTPADVVINDDQINTTRDLRIYHLEQELMQSREQLRALSEEQEATSEEFQSTNEELKTLNEELQTAQEELISTNNELTLRNGELNVLNNELAASKEFAASINNTISDSLLILDTALRIKEANDSFYETFQVTPEDTIDHFLYEIGNGQWNIPELRRLLEEILSKKTELVDFKVEHAFENIGPRVMRLNGRRVRGEKDVEGLILLAIDDITEQTLLANELSRTQELLNINEERQRIAIETANLGTWDYDVSKKQMIISDTGARIIGASSPVADTLEPLFENIHQEDRERVTQVFNNAVQENTAGLFEEQYRLVRPGEKAVSWLSIVGKSFFDDDGKFKRITGIIADITEQKTSSIKLEDTLAQLKFAMHAGEIGSWELTIPEMVLTASSQCKVNFGLPEDAPLSYQDLVNMILPEDRPAMQAAVEHAIATHTLYNHEYRILLPDDSIQWILASGMAKYDNSGIPVNMSGISINITTRKNLEQELKYSEFHFRTLANSSPVMVAMSNATGEFAFFNSQWLDLTGQTADTINTQSFLHEIHSDDRDAFAALFETSTKKHAKFASEFRMRLKDKYRWVSCAAVPRFNNNNKFDGFTIACTDVHDQKVATEKLEKKVQERTSTLRKLNKELEDRNNELEQFAYVTSHDMQEPLRKIKMFTSRILEKDPEDKAEIFTYIRKIELSTIRMIGLIHDLLNYTHLQDKTHGFVETDLNKTLQNISIDFELLIQEKSANLSIGPMPSIDAVPAQMNQLFYNLIGNSLKFARKDILPQITISSRAINNKERDYYQLEPAFQYVVVTVQDNGIGFSQEYEDKIFEIFQRLHNKENYKGNGIGLAMCKRIVQNHNGVIVPTATENKGAKFEVILPTKQH